ncbi:MAG: aminotransferase class III-fold pyridoxal phosphate-dependent enzyme [Thermoanaerobaculaceae bacterium]|nr:aminotransferase class III-fold pyridoxal phosphate-dependent enzyme [Thermoanaerobaculaceae bacterium]
MTEANQPGASALLDVFDQLALRPVRGEGAYLFTADGDRYLDFYGGHAVALLGYGHPALVAALDRQARTLFFQSNIVPLDVRERAAASLVRFGPPGLTRAFFVNSGAEANENALRIAFNATGRTRVVAVEGAFHGRTAAAGAVTAGHERWYGFPSEPFAVTWVPFDDTAALERAVASDVAAVILEPVQGVAGARALSRGFLAAARAATAAAGALLVFDEVQCGMGRTGHPFAAQAHGILPDVLTTAKGLAGGFPAGAVVVGEGLAAGIKKGALGTTFGGGPLAMALVEAVIGAITAEGLLDRVRRLSARLRTECLTGPVTAVQGMGFLLGLRTVPPAKEVLARLRERRILAGGSADPHVVRLLPPLILQDAHVDELVAALKEIRP